MEKIRMQVSQESTKTPIPIAIAVSMGFLAVFAPYCITLIFNETVNLMNLSGPIWSVNANQFEWVLIFGMPSSEFAYFVLIILYLPFLMLRIAFGLQIMKYYQQTTTRSRVLLVGVMSSFSELIAMMSTFRGPYLGYLVVPLPILFILGTFLLWITEEPLIKPPPLRKEPIIILGAVMVFHLSNIFTIHGDGYLVLFLIIILILSEYRRN